MLFAYLNYPEPDVVRHGDPTCQEIRKHAKAGQRLVRIGVRSISDELLKFATGQYAFGSRPANNDMWIQIDFGDTDFEEAVLQFTLHLVCQRYSRFAGIDVRRHC